MLQAQNLFFKQNKIRVKIITHYTVRNSVLENFQKKMIFHYTIHFITSHVAILKYFNLNEMCRLQRISIMLKNTFTYNM